MKSIFSSKLLSVVFSTVLIAAMALTFCSCGGQTPDDTSEPPASSSADIARVVGTGATSFSFTVTDGEGQKTYFTVKTDEKILGTALEKCGLTESQEGPYGRFVVKVNGIFAEYNTTGNYWALLVDGEYSMLGVDSVEVTEGGSYEFRVSE